MSEADSGWFLRHRDGVEHGPFRLADIVGAAEAGNVVEDTSVRHEVHTRGSWVLAGRVQPIAAAMQQRGQAIGQGASGQQPSGSQPAAAAPKSAFRRPRQQPPSATPSPAAATPSPAAATPAAASAPTTATPTAEAAIAEGPGGLESTPSIRMRERSFPVPKTFVDAALALFDFRFRHFITPWIIKILWALAIAGAGLGVTKMIYDDFIQPSMSAPGPRTAPDGGPDWEFEPLAGQSIFQTRAFLFTVRAGTIMLLLLCTRVAMELSIVLFHVAGDVSELKRAFKEERARITHSRLARLRTGPQTGPQTPSSSFARLVDHIMNSSLGVIRNCADLIEAETIRIRLEAAGIRAFVTGTDAATALGMGGAGTMRLVRVEAPTEDVERAIELLEEDERRAAEVGAWICGRCHERNEATFEVCWSCSKPRRDDDELAEDEPPAERPAPVSLFGEAEPGVTVPDDSNPYRPVLIQDTPPKQTAIFPEQRWTEETRRALRAAIASTFVFPPILSFYSVFILLSLDPRAYKIRSLRRRIVIAWCINVIMIPGWLIFWLDMLI